MSATRPLIEVRDLHKSFGENQVLTGIDLAIEEGTTCVILGGSGAAGIFADQSPR